jgi:hypothetical protein
MHAEHTDSSTDGPGVGQYEGPESYGLLLYSGRAFPFHRDNLEPLTQ